MKFEDFKKLTERITYKGKHCIKIETMDWRNGFKPVPEGYVYVSVWIDVICVEDGRPTKVEGGGLQAIRDIEDSSEWSHVSYFKELIISLEMHEVQETFALDGVRVFNLHQRVIELKSELKVA